MPKLKTRRPQTMTTVNFLKDSLFQLEKDVDGARAAESWQAVAALKRLSITTRKDLDEATKAQKPLDGQLESLPEDEYRERLQQSGEAMPDDHLEVLVRVYLERHGLDLVDRGV
ncbi:MAG: hypothetical protein Q8P18_18310 [Pseudomonadota bacterium]|nr:hypothetical protein [Pseudomonadota bacterium]